MAIRVGNEVVLPQGQPAILRWMGRIDGKLIEYAGVELTGPNATTYGKHSGEHNGRKYFSTEVPGTGLFVSYSQLVSANVQSVISRNVFDASPDSALSPASTLSERKNVAAPAEIDQLEKLLAERSAECDRLKAQLAASDPKASDDDLHKLLEEKDQKIQSMRQAHEQKRDEFRMTISQLEMDRNAIADNYEEKLQAMADEYEHKLQSQNSGLNEEIETQRTALAAMQNQMLSESEHLREQREQLEAAQEELEKTRSSRLGDEELDAVLRQLETQEKMLNEMRESISELDELRDKERVQRKELEMLRAGTVDTDNSSVAELRKELDETREQLGLATVELKATKNQLEATTKTLEETKHELEANREELAPLKAELVSVKIELESKKAECEKNGRSSPSEEPEDKVQVSSLKSELAAVKSELQKSRSQSKMLLAELEQVSNASSEISRLEQALEAKVVRESELEAEIERLSITPKDDAPKEDAPKSTPAAAAVPQTASKPSDAAAGRDLWCGLCERDGHTAEECPYED